jgi:hypothetical protein
MQIRVTKLDIARGVPGNTTSCPIARAIRRTTRRIPIVSGFFFSIPGIFRDRAMPQAARDFIHDFDTGRSVQPLTLNLPIPENLRKPCRKV